MGAALTAALTPWIALRMGWTAPFLLGAALSLIGAASWLIVDPTKTLSPAAELSTSESSQVTPATR